MFISECQDLQDWQFFLIEKSMKVHYKDSIQDGLDTIQGDLDTIQGDLSTIQGSVESSLDVIQGVVIDRVVGKRANPIPIFLCC